MADNETFYESMAAIKQEIGHRIAPNATGQYGGFVDLPKVLEVVESAAFKHGVLILQGPNIGMDGKPVLDTELIHTASEVSRSWRHLLVPDKAGPQGLGAAETYARRRSLLSIFGLASGENDDPDAINNGSRQSSSAMSSLPKSGSSLSARDYVITFGKKYANRKLGTIPLAEAIDYANYLERMAKQDGKPLRGPAAEAVRNIRVLQLEAENEPATGFASALEIDEIPF